MVFVIFESYTACTTSDKPSSAQGAAEYLCRYIQISLIQTVLALIHAKDSCKGVVCDVENCITGKHQVVVGG